MDALLSYWSLPLGVRPGPREQLGVLVAVFALVAASVLVLHLFLPGSQPVRSLLLHALQIAVTYVFWFAVLAAGFAMAVAGRWVEPVRVWHLWALSAGCYLLGYFVADFDDPLTFALHDDVDEPGELYHFLRLVPVWLLVTWVFTNAYVGRQRRAEIERLEEINAALSRQDAAAEPGHDRPAASAQRVRLSVGRRHIDLPAADVSHVSVDDHHCYLHYREDGTERKLAVGMPLRELLDCLPDGFLQVHRSHVVNVAAVTRLERRGRAVWLRVGADGAWRLPVSRHRLSEVLPRLPSAP